MVRVYTTSLSTEMRGRFGIIPLAKVKAVVKLLQIQRQLVTVHVIGHPAKIERCLGVTIALATHVEIVSVYYHIFVVTMLFQSDNFGWSQIGQTSKISKGLGHCSCISAWKNEACNSKNPDLNPLFLYNYA